VQWHAGCFSVQLCVSHCSAQPLFRGCRFNCRDEAYRLKEKYLTSSQLYICFLPSGLSHLRHEALAAYFLSVSARNRLSCSNSSAPDGAACCYSDPSSPAQQSQASPRSQAVAGGVGVSRQAVLFVVSSCF